MLTEDDIKRIFPKYLKGFYLNRYEYVPGTESITTDNIAQGGIVADGQFSFFTPEGQHFVSTFEATSADKAGEVKYTLNMVYFLWDCVAFGTLTAAIAYAVAYFSRFTWLVQLGVAGNAGYLMGFWLIGFLSWFFTMRGWRKYRYIYAIEQFKRYYADEQWIALADDVFPAPQDPYLEVLREQCIYHGFGLAIVSANGAVRVVVAPSRLGLYGKDRHPVQWITQRNWYKTMVHNVNVIAQYRPKLPSPLTRTWNKTKRPVQHLLLAPLSKTVRQVASTSRQTAEATWERFMSSQPIQKQLVFVASLFITVLVYRVFSYHEVRVEEIADLSGGNPEDQPGYLYEGEDSKPCGVPKQYPEPAPAATLTTHPETTPPPPTIGHASTASADIPTIDISGIEGEADPASQPCYPYRNLRGWIIADNQFANRQLAESRAEKIRKAGISCEVVPEECLNMGRGFLVKIGRTHARESEARAQGRELQRQLEAAGIGEGDVMVMSVK